MDSVGLSFFLTNIFKISYFNGLRRSVIFLTNIFKKYTTLIDSVVLLFFEPTFKKKYYFNGLYIGGR